MKKYEWDKALRRELRGIPEDEREQVLDYYNELFEDKRDRGDREADILRSFGSPYDAADKILRESRAQRADVVDPTIYGQSEPGYRGAQSGKKYDYADDGRAARGKNAYDQNIKSKHARRAQDTEYNDPNRMSDGGGLLFVLLIIVLWIPLASILFALAVAVLAIVASGFAIAISGVAGVVFTIINLTATGFTPLVLMMFGVSGILIGVGFIMVPICMSVGKVLFRGISGLGRKLWRACKGRRI